MSDRWAMTFGRQRYKALSWVFLALLIAYGLVVGVLNKKQLPIYIKNDDLTAAQLHDVQKVADTLGAKQFYAADLEEIAAAMSQISWVGGTQVYRDWQKGIVVVVKPRVAVANFGSEYLLDASGAVFVPADKSELSNPTFVQLYSDRHHTREVMQKMYRLNEWFAPLGISVVDITLTPRQTWLIKFDSGLRVIVDYDHVDDKLRQLSDLLIQGDLSIALEDIDSVDVRYKNGFAISKKINVL